MKKNVFEKKNEKIIYWNLISKEEKFEITKQFVQVFGGEPDHELEEMIYDRLLKGEISIGMLNFIRDSVRRGAPMIIKGTKKGEWAG